MIEGMLVGTEKDILTTSETHQVLSPIFDYILQDLKRALTTPSLMPTNMSMRVNISTAGQRPESTLSSCPTRHGSDTSRGRGLNPVPMWDIPVSGTCWGMLP